MDPYTTSYTTYWITTAVGALLFMVIGFLGGYAVGLKEGVDMFFVDSDDDESEISDSKSEIGGDDDWVLEDKVII